jgi:hypothetical protein
MRLQYDAMMHNIAAVDLQIADVTEKEDSSDVAQYQYSQ